MSQARDIREATVTELEAIGLTVFDSRIENAQAKESRPFVIVATPAQTDSLDGGAVVSTSTIELLITIFARGNSSLEAFNALDTVEESVKAVLFTSPDWLSLFDKLLKCETQRGGEDGGGNFDVIAQLSMNIATTEQFEYDDTLAYDLNSVLIHDEVGGEATPDIDRIVDTSV